MRRVMLLPARSTSEGFGRTLARASGWYFLCSDVVIQRKLIRVRAQADRIDFLFALVPDPGADDVLGEDVALEQELLVLLQARQRLLQRTRRLGHLGQFLRLQVV